MTSRTQPQLQPQTRADAESLTERVDIWLTGFAESRRVPVRRTGAVTEVEVGATERRLELVLVEPDDALLDSTLARLIGTTDVWSTVFTAAPRAWVLPAGVQEQLTGEMLMTTTLAAARVPTPAVGRLELEPDGDRALVRVVDDESHAAHGQVAVVGNDAIFDRIGTESDYRRRGLGTVVMQCLTAWALEQGAARGILAASPDGQALYAPLGWKPAGAMVTLSGTRGAA